MAVLATEEEKQVKEILYLLIEKVRATKAAFYLAETNSTFRLVSHYGFTRTDRIPDVVGRADPLTTTVFSHREPFYVNDIRQAGQLAGTMEAASSTRMMTAPLYLDGRIVGILDVRDKAGRESFTGDDASWVTEILRRLAVKVRTIPRFSAPTMGDEEDPVFESTSHTFARGPQAFTSAGIRVPQAAFAAEPRDVTQAAMGRPSFGLDEVTSYLPSGTARTLQLVEETLRREPGRRVASTTPGTREASFQRLALRMCLAYPEVELAAITLVDLREAQVLVSSRVPMLENVASALFENVEKVAGKGFPYPSARSVKTLDVLASERPPLARDAIAAIQSSVLSGSSEEASILSLVLVRAPDDAGRERLRDLHLFLKNALVEIRGAGRYREAYRVLVNKLLEPGIKKFSGLKQHSFNVGRMARTFASQLSLSPNEIEQITVAAILHDIGMKELNYDEIYAKRTLTEEEIRLVREHPRVGAFLVDEIPWPYPITPLIRYHHERWDGAGYPEGLRAEQIPFGARIIHLCEAFDAMTSPTSYRSVLTVTQSLDIIVGKAGTQFDPELAPAFRRMVEGLKA